MLRLGAHMSIGGGFHNAFDRGETTGCDTMQIFTKNNRQWNSAAITAEQVDAWLERRATSSIAPVFIHGIYLMNLASPTDSVRERSIEALVDELERAHLLELPWVIIHPGSHGGLGEERGLQLITEGVLQTIERTKTSSVRICLETTAGMGTSIGSKFEHLAELYARIDAPERLCVCLDTCHIFSSGYAFDTPEAYAATMGEFDRIVGIDRLACLHLNDSKTKFGLNKDRHEHIGEGHIGLEPFGYFLNDPRLAKVPMVIETPVEKDEVAEDRRNLAALRGLIKA